MTPTEMTEFIDEVCRPFRNLRPNYTAIIAAATDRRHGLDDNDGALTDEDQQALMATMLAGDTDMWHPEVEA